MSENNDSKGFLSGLIIGSAIGAGLFFLFGTEKGKKVQKLLKIKGEEAAEDLQDLLGDLEEKGKDFKDKAEEVAQEVKEKVEETIEDKGEGVKEQIGEKIDTALSKIEELQEHGRQTTASIHADLKRRLFKNLPKK